jgi:glutamate formiminotransferase
MQSCAIYLSTGVASVASQVAACAARFTRVVVVDTFTDSSYARSSIKLVGVPADLLAAVKEASIHALSLIDLSQQPLPARHPRCGAVDLISFMPLSERRSCDLVDDMKVCQCFSTTALC